MTTKTFEDGRVVARRAEVAMFDAARPGVLTTLDALRREAGR